MVAVFNRSCESSSAKHHRGVIIICVYTSTGGSQQLQCLQHTDVMAACVTVTSEGFHPPVHAKDAGMYGTGCGKRHVSSLSGLFFCHQALSCTFLKCLSHVKTKRSSVIRLISGKALFMTVFSSGAVNYGCLKVQYVILWGCLPSGHIISTTHPSGLGMAAPGGRDILPFFSLESSQTVRLGGDPEWSGPFQGLGAETRLWCPGGALRFIVWSSCLSY